MGTFIEIIMAMMAMYGENNDEEQLCKFLDVIKTFNSGKPLNEKLKKQIESFFDYKWSHDKNSAIDDEDEQEILDELPSYVQDKLYVGFLFCNFIKKFKRFLTIEKNSKILRSKDLHLRRYYTMIDNPYRDFIIRILTSLEPRFEKKGTTLINELDEFGEITFIEKGKIGIGYEINKHKKLPL